jgi:hypothetical protein
MKAASVCVVASALLVPLAGCGSTASSSRPAASRAPTDLLTFVPSETPYVANLTPEIIELTVDTLGAQLLGKLRSKIIDEEKLPASTPRERLRSEILRELAPFDTAALAKVGWDSKKASAVVYGVGLTPVLRATMNGPNARALIERAATRAGITLETRESGGVPFAIIPALEESGPSIVVAFHPQQIAAALTKKPDEIVSHLVSLAPAAPSLATSNGAKPRDPTAPAGAQLYFAIEPARIADALRGGDLVVLSVANDATPACLNSVADLIDDVPPITYELWREGDTAIGSYTFPINALLAGVIPTNVALPRWVDNPAPDAQLAVGLKLGPVFALVDDIAGRIQDTRVACGKEREPSPQLSKDFEALTHVHGLNAVGELDRNAIRYAAVLDTDDGAAVWKWIGAHLGSVPLPDLPPHEIHRLGEIGGFPFMAGYDSTTIVASLGAIEHAEKFIRPGAFKPVKGSFLHLHLSRDLVRAVRAGQVPFFGADFELDSGNDIVASVFGGMVVVRTTGDLRPLAPAK